MIHCDNWQSASGARDHSRARDEQQMSRKSGPLAIFILLSVLSTLLNWSFIPHQSTQFIHPPPYSGLFLRNASSVQCLIFPHVIKYHDHETDQNRGWGKCAWHFKREDNIITPTAMRPCQFSSSQSHFLRISFFMLPMKSKTPRDKVCESLISTAIMNSPRI